MVNARRIVQESGAHALKVEGAGEVISTIQYLTNAGIPVVAHLGLTPQSVGVVKHLSRTLLHVYLELTSTNI